MQSSSAGDLVTIGRAATRIAGLAANLAQAHNLGTVPGAHREPWNLPYHHDAIPIYLETLPPNYLVPLGAHFGSCAEAMSAIDAPDDLATAWGIVYSYLRFAAQAIHAELGVRGPYDRPGGVLESATPGVMRFDRLGELVHPEGVHHLGEAARVVADYCTAPHVEITAEQKLWLRGLAAGEPVADLAERHGFSRRTMHRELAAFWAQLGVDNTPGRCAGRQDGRAGRLKPTSAADGSAADLAHMRHIPRPTMAT